MKELPIIFIVGPTAVGKTDLAVKLAESIGAEIVSCDSMLVYKEPKIIVNKPPLEYLKRVKHYLIETLSVTEEFNVYEFRKAADEILAERYPKNNLIFTGGSGLYVKALVDGIFKGPGASSEIREQILQEKDEKGLEKLYSRLQEIDPRAGAKISPNDQRRIVRALEVYRLTGVPISQRQKDCSGWSRDKEIKIFGLKMGRSLLYENINKRTEKMFENGAVEEVKEMLSLNLSKTARKIIGIKDIKNYIEEKQTLKEAKEEMKKNTRRFAKRQMTWFKADERIKWIDVTDKNLEKAKNKILDDL